MLKDKVVEVTTQVQYDQLIDEVLYIAMISVSLNVDSSYEASVAAIDKRDLLIDKVEKFIWHGKLGQDILLDLLEKYCKFTEVFSMEVAKKLL